MLSEENFKLTLKIDGKNTARGTNQIIVYTFDNRSENNGTDTNEYGYELAIDQNNRVCEKGTHVKFHEQGIIISAHGTNGDLLADKIKVGDQVFYSHETNHLVFTREMKDVALRFKSEINDIKNKLIRLETGLYDVDIESFKDDFKKIEQNYQKITAMINQDKKINKTLLNKVEDELYELKIKMVPSIVVESRGCWHRPNILGTESTVEGIDAFLSLMKDIGFNSVYVETFWWGRSISNSKITHYHPRVKDGNYGDYEDFLHAFIDIAHKKDMEVHAWTETFFIGGEKEEEVPQWIEGKKHWLNTTYKGSSIQTGKGTEEGFIFLDPSNEEVKDFLISYYKELATYPLDGIQFDYIRYPHENNIETSSGYTIHAMNQFKNEKGLNKNVDLKVLLSQDEKLFEDWKNFRRNHVSNFMQRAVNEIKKVNPSIKISIAVGSDPKIAKDVLLQDWPTWIENGFIDIIAPMAYSRDIDYIHYIVNKMNGISNGFTYNYTGIGTFMEFPEFENVEQMIASRKENGLGAILFASQYIINNEKMQKVLKKGIYSKKAITPNSSIKKLLTVLFADILDKVNRIYIPKNRMTLKLKELLDVEFYNIKQIEDLKDMISKLNQLILNIPKDADCDAADRIIDDLNYLIIILKIKLNNKEKKI